MLRSCEWVEWWLGRACRVVCPNQHSTRLCISPALLSLLTMAPLMISYARGAPSAGGGGAATPADLRDGAGTTPLDTAAPLAGDAGGERGRGAGTGVTEPVAEGRRRARRAVDWASRARGGVRGGAPAGIAVVCGWVRVCGAARCRVGARSAEERGAGEPKRAERTTTARRTKTSKKREKNASPLTSRRLPFPPPKSCSWKRRCLEWTHRMVGARKKRKRQRARDSSPLNSPSLLTPLPPSHPPPPAWPATRPRPPASGQP